MAEIEAMKTISEVARQVAVLQENYSQADLERLIQIGIQGYTDMMIYDIPHVSRKKISVSDGLVANLPADFVKENRVLALFDGELTPLKKYTVNLNSEEECGDTVAGIQEQDEIHVGKVRMGEDIGANYNVGGEFEYRFDIDMKTRTIVFNKMVPNKTVFMEYIGSGISDSGETYIPLIAVTPLRSYIIWQKDLLNSRIAQSEKIARMKEYETTLDAMRHHNSMMSYQEYMDEYWSNLHNGIRR